MASTLAYIVKTTEPTLKDTIAFLVNHNFNVLELKKDRVKIEVEPHTLVTSTNRISSLLGARGVTTKETRYMNVLAEDEVGMWAVYGPKSGKAFIYIVGLNDVKMKMWKTKIKKSIIETIDKIFEDDFDSLNWSFDNHPIEVTRLGDIERSYVENPKKTLTLSYYKKGVNVR